MATSVDIFLMRGFPGINTSLIYHIWRRGNFTNYPTPTALALCNVARHRGMVLIADLLFKIMLQVILYIC